MFRKSAFVLLLFTACLFHAKAQDSLQIASLRKYQSLDISYAFGGQIYNNNLIYNPGLAIQASYGKRLGESVGIGLGTGYTSLKDEHFLPLFIEAMGSRKNKISSTVVKMQLGYALGWYSGNLPAEGYKFRGGIFVDAGLGRKFAVSPDYSLYFHWSYRHQFAHMEYEVFGGQHYTEALNYDMLVISLGIIRNY